MTRVFANFVCERCKSDFVRTEGRHYRFCSQTCANRSKLKVDLDQLKSMALLGSRIKEISDHLNVHPTTVRKAIEQLGIYRQWTLMRYSKCRGLNG